MVAAVGTCMKENSLENCNNRLHLAFAREWGGGPSYVVWVMVSSAKIRVTISNLHA